MEEEERDTRNSSEQGDDGTADCVECEDEITGMVTGSAEGCNVTEPATSGECSVTRHNVDVPHENIDTCGHSENNGKQIPIVDQTDPLSVEGGGIPSVSGPDSGKDDSPEACPPTYDMLYSKKKPEKKPAPLQDKLPSYNEAADQGQFVSDGPPSYHSLFRDTVLRAVNPFSDDTDVEGSNPSLSEPARRLRSTQPVSLMMSILLLVVVFGVVFVLPVCMIAIGVSNIQNCPAQPRIPIYLIVLGFFQMLECCGRLCYKLFASRNPRNRNSWRERYRRKDPIVYFTIIWFVIGSLWVYQTKPDFASGEEKGLIHPTHPPARNFTDSWSVNTTVSGSVTTSASIRTLDTSTPGRVTSSNYCDKVLYRFAFWVITTYYGTIALFCFLVLADFVVRFVSQCCRNRQYNQ